MKPIKFKEHNKVYAKNQPQYLQLPVYEDNEQGGRVFHCWQFTLWERIKILFIGKLWISIRNFKQPLQPIAPFVYNPFRKKLLSIIRLKYLNFLSFIKISFLKSKSTCNIKEF
jgi:hypothetical protein